MKILVIGGTNFIDPPAIRQLHAMGNEVTVFHRGRTPADVLQLNFPLWVLVEIAPDSIT